MDCFVAHRVGIMASGIRMTDSPFLAHRRSLQLCSGSLYCSQCSFYELPTVFRLFSRNSLVAHCPKIEDCVKGATIGPEFQEFPVLDHFP